MNEKYVLGYNPIPTRPDIKASLVDILLTKAELYQQQLNGGTESSEIDRQKLLQQFSEMNKLVAKIEKKAANNLALSANLASFNFQMGNIEKGIENLNRAIQLAPFETSLWYSKIKLYFELTKTYFNNADDENAKKYLDEGLNIIKKAAEVNSKNMNPFMFDEKATEILQVMRYIHDYYDQPEMDQINELIHYTIPNLDINLDQVPDQWQKEDNGLISVIASDQGLDIHTTEKSFIYIRNPLKLTKDEKYYIEVRLDKPVGGLSFEIVDLTGNLSMQQNGNNQYSSEFLIENDPDEKGNQLRIYVDTDCMIETIKITKSLD